MTARSFPVPLSVIDADERRDALILAEHLRDQQSIIREFHAYYDGKKTVQNALDDRAHFAAEGLELEIRWLRDSRGIPFGVELYKVPR